jgi:hypothetical protein
MIAMRKLISFLLLARLFQYLFGSRDRAAGQSTRRSRTDSRKKPAVGNRSASETRMPDTGATNNPRPQSGSDQFGQGSDKTH